MVIRDNEKYSAVLWYDDPIKFRGYLRLEGLAQVKPGKERLIKILPDIAYHDNK